MPRPPEVRWSPSERSWVSDSGEPYVDPSGRRRRRRVYFRADDRGPIPYGSKPRSEGYLRASACLRKLIAASRAEPVAAGPTALGLARAYLANCEARVRAGDLKARSLASVREALGVFLDWPEADPVGHHWADQVDRSAIRAFLESRPSPTGHYPRRVVSAVLAAWAWAWAEGVIASNPLAGVKRPRGPARTGRRPDREAFRRWLRAAWSRARAKPRHRRVNRIALLLIRALADTGARPGELCAARWADLDRERLLLAPAAHKTARRGKARVILFPRRWTRALDLLARIGHADYLFTHGQHRPRKAAAVRLGDASGEPWNPTALATWARRWAMPCALYDLRRMVASELADAGLDYGRIADLLGNSPAIVRSVYSTRSAASLREDLDRAKAARVGPPAAIADVGAQNDPGPLR